MTQLVTTATGSILAVQRFGPASDGSFGPASDGPPIVVVPGWCCDLASVEPLVGLLADHRPVVVVDLPGHGASPASSAPGDLSLDSLAGEVLAVVAALGLERPAVVGHSMGGLIALACASHPELVSAAVLLDPAPIVASRGKEFFGRSIVEVAADREGAWRRRFVERLIPREDVPGRAGVIDTFTGVPTELAAAECRAIAEADGQAALAQVRVPVLMVTAGAPEAEAVDLLPSVVLGRVVGSHHFIQLEVPDQVAAMVERFLEVNVGGPELLGGSG